MNRWWLLLVVAVAGAAYYFLYFNPVSRVSTNEVYLKRYASVMTTTGVYGFPPGTKLTLEPTRQVPPGTVAVTDGTHEIAVEPDALTRNPELAQQLADADQQGQTQAKAGVNAMKAHVSKVESDAQLARARDVERMNELQRKGLPIVLPTPVATPPPHR